MPRKLDAAVVGWASSYPSKKKKKPENTKTLTSISQDKDATLSLVPQWTQAVTQDFTREFFVVLKVPVI